jgi:hypothetical protein
MWLTAAECAPAFQPERMQSREQSSKRLPNDDFSLDDGAVRPTGYLLYKCGHSTVDAVACVPCTGGHASSTSRLTEGCTEERQRLVQGLLTVM